MVLINEASAPEQKPVGFGGWGWLVVYGLLSLAIEWPLLGSLTTHISYGQETEATVPLLNVWTVWWNADRAWHGFRGYWNSPIFYPTKATFVFSESQPTSLVVAPVLWLTGNRGLAYNVYQLLILALNGYSAHGLFRRLGHVPWLAFCGGVMSQILPFVIWQFGVVQLTTLYGIYWTLHAILDLFHTKKSPTIALETPVLATISEPTIAPSGLCTRSGIRLGLAFGVTYWSCNYWGLFLLLLLVPCSVCFWNEQLLRRSFWWNVGLAASIAAAMIGPFAWLQQSLAKSHDWQTSRTDDMILGLSSHWRDHTDVPWNTWSSWLEFPEADRNNGWALGGGGLKLLLVPIGLLAAFAIPCRRRWGIFAFLMGMMAFGLSLGPTIQIWKSIPLVGTVCPYDILKQYVPGFSLIRSPFRFALFVQLAAVWLSVEALDLLNPSRWGRPSFSFPRYSLGKSYSLLTQEWTRSIPVHLPLLLASTLIALETVPTTSRLYRLPSPGGLPVWVMWLRDSAEPGGSVACLPFPRGNQVEDYEEATVWMYYGTYHGRPLLNGYSGFFPLAYNELKEGLEQFQRPSHLSENETIEPKFAMYAWDNPGLKRLNESGARYVVVKRSFGTPDDVRGHPLTRFRWALVASDEIDQMDIYELPAPDRGVID